MLAASAAGLVYAVRTWDGEYFSRDVPGGVVATLARSRLWRVALDGGDCTALTGPEENAEHPQVTRDGRWVYFQAQVQGLWRVRRMRSNGAEMASVAPVDPTCSAYGAALSADGSQVVWTQHDGRTGATFLAQADGTGARRIAPEFGYIYMAAVDASARRVVFSGPARDYRLSLAAAPDWEPRVLTPDLPDAFVPQFTPDGGAVVFIDRRGGLYVMTLAGAERRQLADRVQVEFFLSPQDEHGSTDVPSISPDGCKVAFVQTGSNSPPQIAVVEIATGHVEVMTRPAGVCGRVRWSPDGKHLGFVSFVGPRPQLFVMAAAGGAPRQITQEIGAVCAFDWIPVPAPADMGHAHRGIFRHA